MRQLAFIVGVGRSGTSLLHSLLGAHPDVTPLPETSFLRRYVFGDLGKSTDPSNDARVARVPTLQSALNALNPITAASCLAAYRDVCAGQQTPYVLDKDPRLIEFLHPLKRCFQTAKIIHIIRDQRDVIASKKSAKWSSGRSLLAYVGASRAQLMMARQFADADLHEVHFEQLIAAPDQQLQRIFDFLDLRRPDGPLDHISVSEAIVAGDEKAWKGKTFMPVDNRNRGKFVDTLSPREIRWIDAALRDLPNLPHEPWTATAPPPTFTESVGGAMFAAAARFASTAYVQLRRRRNRRIVAELVER